MRVSVVAYRTQPQWEGADAPLTDALCAALRECSGQPWTVTRYIVERELPPMRGDKVELRQVLDRHALWAAGWVWLWGDGTAGFLEQYWLEPGRGVVLWPDVSTDNLRPVSQRLFVLGLNVERDLACALHSFSHLVERVWDDRVPEQYRPWTGREPDPFDVYRLPLNGEVPRRDGGVGNVHTPPGAVRHYQYNGPGCERWGCTHEPYLRWWLKNAPSYWWQYLG